MTISADILIVGGGIAGLTFANMLAKETSLSIVVLEANLSPPAWSEDHHHHRVSAITLASKKMLEHLFIWETIKRYRVSPFTQIKVWNDLGQGELHFDSLEIAESTLGFIIENNVLEITLQENLKQFPQVKIISPVKLQHFYSNETGVQVVTEEGLVITASLAVAADGAHSWLRQQADIPVEKHAFGETAIVTSVITSLPHEKIARQVFLNTGPLAFLPLVSPCLSSIVWTLPTAAATSFMELNDNEFKEKLNLAFSNRLGCLLNVSERYSFPLYKQQAKHYIKPRIALIGDAAHTIHPLAGQGINMALLDAAALTDVIVQAISNHRDFSSSFYLRRYERSLWADHFAMMKGVDIIKQVFESPKPFQQSLLSFSLNLGNQLPWIKNIFTRHAVGKRVFLPRWAKR